MCAETAILIVSIGNSCIEGCKAATDAIQNAMIQRFLDNRLYEAFLCRSMGSQSKKNTMDSVQAILRQIKADGRKTLIVQPTFLMHGYEYHNLKRMLEPCRDEFDAVFLGEPLLTSEDDFETVRIAVTRQAESEDDETTAVCLVGHGGGAAFDNVYIKMQQVLAKAGHKNYYIGTLKAEPSLEDIKEALRTGGNYRTVALRPFMTAAGGHTCRDIAGDQSGSWKRALQQEGYEVSCRLEGLGQLPAVQDLYVAHAKAASRL